MGDVEVSESPNFQTNRIFDGQWREQGSWYFQEVMWRKENVLVSPHRCNNSKKSKINTVSVDDRVIDFVTMAKVRSGTMHQGEKHGMRAYDQLEARRYKLYIYRLDACMYRHACAYRDEVLYRNCVSA